MSPSSRRAWIEIDRQRIAYTTISVALLAEGVDRNLPDLCRRSGQHVALLAEGVDRNVPTGYTGIVTTLSPSSRRAWIEISLTFAADQVSIVALLAEGVDRNTDAVEAKVKAQRRPPRGGRG